MAHDSLEQILRRLSEKMKMVNSSVEALRQDRIMLEARSKMPKNGLNIF